MADIWLTSDTHFFHGNILKFTGADGRRIRAPFQSLEEMHETMIERWNAAVKHDDHVYHLGDVTFRYDAPFRELMTRLNGRKRLLFGNHDRVKGTCLLDYFEKFFFWRVFDEVVLSHMPLRDFPHPDKVKLNVHGHIHQNTVMRTTRPEKPTRAVYEPDPRFMNVCVEVTDYHPVHLDEAIMRARNL